MSSKISDLKSIEYSATGKIVRFNEPIVMAIVNITPDSFYDGGKFGSIDDVVRDVEEKASAGASIIDLGAASTRPSAEEITAEEEWKRLAPVLKTVRQRFPDLLISVDTYRSEIAKQAAGEGADMINDIGGGKLDEKMLNVIATLQLPYVLMHIQGTPATMQIDPQYRDVTVEVMQQLKESISELERLGFSKIIVDPGFGFGKTVEHNYSLLKNLARFNDLGYPVLAGVSRKGMINKVLGTNPVTALNGTTVLNTIALLNGASILRVHDVKEALQAITLVKSYNSAQ